VRLEARRNKHSMRWGTVEAVSTVRRDLALEDKVRLLVWSNLEKAITNLSVSVSVSSLSVRTKAPVQNLIVLRVWAIHELRLKEVERRKSGVDDRNVAPSSAGSSITSRSAAGRQECDCH
jgi:hypothetical protein